MVTGDGALVNSQIEMVLDTDTRTLTMKDINDSYIQSFVFIQVKIGELVNPPKTQPSGTFTLSVFDSLGGLIETVDQGLYFLPLPG